jgi:hypothetical protein
VSSSGIVTLSGANQYQSMDFDEDSGIYKISFTRPAQLAAEINNLIIQSADI